MNAFPRRIWDGCSGYGLLQGTLDCGEDLDSNLRLGLFFRRAVAAGDALRVSEALAHGLRRELVKLESLDSVNGETVAGVDDGKATRNWLGIDVPNHLLLVPEFSITSSTPGRSCSTVGICDERIPRSPVEADTFTWVTSVSS